MRPVLNTKTIVGQRTYNFGFDYLSKEFIRVVIDGRELNYPNDYSVDSKAVNLKVAPTEIKPMIIYRNTSTQPFVEWKDSSIMTAKDMNLQERQALHINEESNLRHQEVKDWHYQSKEDRKVIVERAEEVARHTQEVEDNKTIVVYQARMVSENTETVRNMTAHNDITKAAIDTMLPEIRQAHVDTLEKARTVDTQYNSVNDSRTHVDIMVQEVKDTLATAKEWAGGDFYTKREIDAKLAQEATQAIANIVDNAPSTLDTLQELARALNNDPNFATTMTNLIGTKATLQQVYPVGSIYLSTVATNPSTLFGFGTWEHIEAGRFLLAQGGKYANGATGGSETHTLNTYELPSHNHLGSVSRAGGHSHSGSSSNAGGHSHGVFKWRQKINPNPTNGQTEGRAIDIITYTASRNSMNNTRYNTIERDNNEWGLLSDEGWHNHTMNINHAGDHSHSIPAEGQDRPHNNMPPYLAVYIWKRTA